MADILLEAQSKSVTPAPGQAVIAINNITKRLQIVDEAGFSRTLGYVNFSISEQFPTATVRTYITGSNIFVPANSLQVGTLFAWQFTMTKTAAGTAASTVDIAFGINGNAADAARLPFTKPVGTAVADEGVVSIYALCRGPVGAAGVVTGVFTFMHNLENTGHAIIPVAVVRVQSAGFDFTSVTNIGLCITTGASDAITLSCVTARADNI